MGGGHVTRHDAECVRDETSGIGLGPSRCRDRVGTGVERVITATWWTLGWATWWTLGWATQWTRRWAARWTRRWAAWWTWGWAAWRIRWLVVPIQGARKWTQWGLIDWIGTEVLAEVKHRGRLLGSNGGFPVDGRMP